MILKYFITLLSFLCCIIETKAQETDKSYPSHLLEIYKAADQSKPGKFKKAPVIGITTTWKGNMLSVGYDYSRAVELAGGIPLLIPSTNDPALLDAITSMIDGLLMTGGPDVHPSYYGHEPQPKLGEVNDKRDEFELLLFRKSHKRGMPIFGICRGMQIINVAMGGTLWQDIPTDFNTDINHQKRDDSTIPAHDISIMPKSLAAKIFGTTKVGVNSRHHQCVRDIAPKLRITAWSPDSVPEILEGYPEERLFAVQFHPEIFAVHTTDVTMPLFFSYFVKECRKWAKTYVKKKK